MPRDTTPGHFPPANWTLAPAADSDATRAMPALEMPNPRIILIAAARGRLVSSAFRTTPLPPEPSSLFSGDLPQAPSAGCTIR
jgi:hypothetical protein